VGGRISLSHPLEVADNHFIATLEPARYVVSSDRHLYLTSPGMLIGKSNRQHRQE
jgi:hypothetical protein